MLHLSGLLIGVTDLHVSRPFYESLFDVTFKEFRPPFGNFFLNGIEFDIEEDADYRDPHWKSLHIGTRKPFSFETDDLAAFLQKAESIGARIVQPLETKPWGYLEAIIADPDGNELLIEQEI